MFRSLTPPAVDTLVINWHITEVCNFECGYCYAKWEADDRPTELIHDRAATTRLLRELAEYFRPGGAGMSRTAGMEWKRLRLNLAGGEPLLYPDSVLSIAEQARNLGFELSIISNGSSFDERLVVELAPMLSLLGLSVDSGDPKVLAAIGRQDRRKRLLDLEELRAYADLFRRIQPGLELKLNTVVCSANWHDDLSVVIDRFVPRRWKVLRMLPVVSHDLHVTDEQFRAFGDRHRSFAHLTTVEDNSDMRDSYIMIDPHGRFFQNLRGANGYVYSRPINQVGAAAAFSSVSWSADAFKKRYPPNVVGALT